MKNTKIFISHSSFEADIASSLVEFLVRGVGIDESLIFCSTKPGFDIPVGVNFNDYILKQLKEDNVIVIAIISNNYYNSKYCLYELGAAWGLCKNNIIPFLVRGMKYGSLQDFISYNQAIDGESASSINSLKYFFQTGDIPLKNIHPSVYDEEKDKLKNICIPLKKNLEPIFSPIYNNAYPQFKYKIVAFDFDGTILHGDDFSHSWEAVWDFLNYERSIREELKEKHLKNYKDYTFLDWCTECVDYYIKAGFNKKYIHEIIRKHKLTIAEGFDITVKLLKDFGFKIVIISGGIDSFYYETVSKTTQNLIDKVFINEFRYNPKGDLTGVKPYQKKYSDGVGKTKVISEYCVKNGYSLEDVAFIGDQTNDIEIATQVGISFAYPAEKASWFTRNLNKSNDKVFRPLFDKNIASVLSEILIKE